MPNPGQVNNPSGLNNFDHFAPEPPYGEVTKQKALAGAAPMAGGPVASGALNAARQSQRQAISGGPSRPTRPAPMSSEPAPIPAAPQTASVMTTAEAWAALAAEPGADQYPIIQEMAARARG